MVLFLLLHCIIIILIIIIIIIINFTYTGVGSNSAGYFELIICEEVIQLAYIKLKKSVVKVVIQYIICK